MVRLEVCVESASGVRAARAGGADAVELCTGLQQGGLTPSAGAVVCALGLGDGPLRVLVRPRTGDFVYAEPEVEAMERDLDFVRERGAAGVALGCLTLDGAVDVRRMERLLGRAGTLEATFHRAFDSVADPLRELEVLVGLGFARVLTAGQAQSALAGRERIAELVRAARGRIRVVAAGGVRAENAAEIVRVTGVAEVHCSASTRRASAMQHRNPSVRLASGEGDAHDFSETDVELVSAMVRSLARA